MAGQGRCTSGWDRLIHTTVLAAVSCIGGSGLWNSASAWGQGAATAGQPLQVGGLGLGLEATRFDALAQNTRAYGNQTRAFSDSVQSPQPAAGFDPSRARPRIPAASPVDTSPAGLKRDAAQPMDALPALPSPMVGHSVGVRLRLPPLLSERVPSNR